MLGGFDQGVHLFFIWVVLFLVVAAVVITITIAALFALLGIPLKGLIVIGVVGRIFPCNRLVVFLSIFVVVVTAEFSVSVKLVLDRWSLIGAFC